MTVPKRLGLEESSLSRLEEPSCKQLRGKSSDLDYEDLIGGIRPLNPEENHLAVLKLNFALALALRSWACPVAAFLESQQ